MGLKLQSGLRVKDILLNEYSCISRLNGGLKSAFDAMALQQHQKQAKQGITMQCGHDKGCAA